MEKKKAKLVHTTGAYVARHWVSRYTSLRVYSADGQMGRGGGGVVVVVDKLYRESSKESIRLFYYCTVGEKFRRFRNCRHYCDALLDDELFPRPFFHRINFFHTWSIHRRLTIKTTEKRECFLYFTTTGILTEAWTSRTELFKMDFPRRI